jgi:ParB-like chromosome segregation protein Spo0J
MNTITVKISEVKNNPNNPRVIKDDKFEKLVKSIKEFPKMLEIRPIVVNDDMIVLGGNMRLKACKAAGLKEVPIIKASELTEGEQKQFIIKDNVSGGEWDWEALAGDWNADELEEWGLDVPEFGDTMTNNEDYEGLDQLSKLDKFMNAELKRMFLVFDNETFEKVVGWFEKKQADFNVEDNSQVILKLMENENI